MASAWVDEAQKDQQYVSIGLKESHGDSEDPQYSNSAAATSMQWRPFWLRRTVLFGFVLVFLLVITTVQTLLAISNQYNGITTSSASNHYLWTYGPTAFLTILAGLWGRTEYQSKLTAPWLHLSQGPSPASRTLLLDYLSPSQPSALVASLRNRDFTVSVGIVTSILIKILIVVSTGLISLSPTIVNQESHTMVIQNKFVEDRDCLRTPGNLAAYILESLNSKNLTLPDGISHEYAFQSVRTNLPDTAETHVTVEGLTNSLACEPVQLSLIQAIPPQPQIRQPTMNISLSSADCDVPLLAFEKGPDYEGNWTSFLRFQRVQCKQSAHDTGRRILTLFGNMTYHTDLTQYVDTYEGKMHPIYGNLTESTQMLCVPRYAIDKVEVARNGTQIKSVKPLPGAASRLLHNVSAWDIVDAQFASDPVGFLKDGLVSYGRSVNVSGINVDVDDLTWTAVRNLVTPDLQASDFFDADFLENVTNSYFQQSAAVIAKSCLLKPAMIEVDGKATIMENRLHVSAWTAWFMTAITATCGLLTTVTFFTVPKTKILPCKPSTLLELAFLFLNSQDLATKLRSLGASSKKSLARCLGPSSFQSVVCHGIPPNQAQLNIIEIEDLKFDAPGSAPQMTPKFSHPFVLNPISRLALCLSVAGLIATLEILLQKSNLEDGLGDAGNETYLHYTWTAIPALVFGALSMVFSLIDFQVRTLGPSMALKQSISARKFMQLDFLNMTIPVAIFREIQLKALWALSLTTAFLLASLFTTFSASLFQVSNIAVVDYLALRANESFLISADTQYKLSATYDTPAEISSLILASNYSFPRYTYNDLAFPSLLFSTPSNISINSSDVSVHAVIPALRGKMECRLYNSSRIRYNLSWDDESPLEAHIDQEGCDDDFKFYPQVFRNTTYFGQSVAGWGSWNYSCHLLTYVWGHLNTDAEPAAVQHISALGCDLTVEAVDVNATFNTIDLDLDVTNPPQVLNNTARNSTAINNAEDFGGILTYYSLVTIQSGFAVLDQFFSLLVTSPWAVPIAALRDPSMDRDVSAAIQTHSNMILAQRLRAYLAPANETNATLAGPIKLGDSDAQPMYNATVIDRTGRRRVVQDALATHILAGLLAAALVLFIIGWITSPPTDVLPRSPTSIASNLALVVGGNIMEKVWARAPFRSPEEMAEALDEPDTRICMGWGTVPDEEGMSYGGENEGGIVQFGIFVAKKEDMEQSLDKKGSGSIYSSLVNRSHDGL
ncbi:hypothetical protein GGR57DRAFT_84884 [Xylariaceae sp. FL1272]|nr:hypothetical protein GGR57DRAFT_84884 [Xylariaceae sp. FL1272]